MHLNLSSTWLTQDIVWTSLFYWYTSRLIFHSAASYGLKGLKSRMLHLPLKTQQPASDSDSSELLLGSGAILRKHDEGTTTYLWCEGTSVGNTQRVLISVMHIGSKAMSKSIQNIKQRTTNTLWKYHLLRFPTPKAPRREKSSPLTSLSRSTLAVWCLHFKGLKGSVAFLVKSGTPKVSYLGILCRKTLQVHVLRMSSDFKHAWGV